MTTPLVDLLCQRVSSPRLIEPAPNQQELEKIFQSAFRAPDHMMLRPWRYLVIEGAARDKLGALFVASAKLSAEVSGEDINEFKVDKLKAMPLRAPMLVVAISSLVDNPKVPHEEQLLSCGVGVGYMLLALQALGYGGIWRTGDMAVNKHVCEGLGLKSNESIVGFLYLGTPAAELKTVSELNVQDYVQAWA